MGDPPWKQPGKKGKPNNHAARGPTPAEARLLASMRSASHEAQRHSPASQALPDGGQIGAQAANSRWQHRKEEWECVACKTRNLTTRSRCRTCLRNWCAACRSWPCGSHPPPRGGSTSERPSGSSKVQTPEGEASTSAEPVRLAEAAVAAAVQAGASEATIAQLKTDVEAKKQAEQAKNSLQSEPIRLAEAALEAAQKAGSGEPTINQLRMEVEARKQEEQAKQAKQAQQAKQPLQAVAQKLQQATRWATQCENAGIKAEERLAAAQLAATTAREALAQARAQVDELTREVAKTGRLDQTKPAPGAEAALSQLLEAVRATKQGQEGSAALLETAAASAEAALTPPPAHGESRLSAPSEAADVDMHQQQQQQHQQQQEQQQPQQQQ